MPGEATLVPNGHPDPTAKVYSWTAQDFRCLLMTAELSPSSIKGIAENPDAVDRVFRERKELILKSEPRTRLISETQLHDAGTNCVETRIETENVVTVSRCYVKGPYMIVSAIEFLHKTDIVKEQSDRFFDSLKLADLPIAEKPAPAQKKDPNEAGKQVAAPGG